MISGSDSPCLYGENGCRVPNHAGLPQIEEATVASFTIPATACHSAIWDSSFPFLDTFAALGKAFQLQGEVILSSSTCTSKQFIPAHSEALPSCSQKQGLFVKKKKTRFNSVVESITHDGFPDVEPLSSVIAEGEIDEISWMARAPQRREPPSSSDLDSDFETHTPTSPDSFGHGQMWTSIQIYDMHANFARGRVQVQPPEATFAQARRLLGYTHHQVAEIFDIRPVPQDLDAAHISPVLLLQHDDVLFGDHRRAVLLDVEMHGESFDTIMEIDRYTTFLPSPVHRSFLLQIAGVAPYCKLQQERCLVWHKGHLIPLQQRGLLNLQHGDYIKIAVPPFVQPSVPTPFAVRACQAGMDALQLVQHFHTHGADTESLHTALTNEQETVEEGDNQMLLQTTFLQIPDFLTQIDLPLPKSCSFTDEFINAVRAREQALETQPFQAEEVPGLIDSSQFVRQLFDIIHDAALPIPTNAEPVYNVETWYTDHQRFQRCHFTRIVRLGSDFRYWERQLRLEWRDHIDERFAVDFHIVHPQTEDADIGSVAQIILVQNAADQHCSIVLSIYDSAYDDGWPHSHAVVTSNRASLQTIIELADFSEFCPPVAPANACSLWFGGIPILMHQQLALRHGYALRLTVERPPEADFPVLQDADEATLRSTLEATLGNLPSGDLRRPLEVITPVDDTWRPDWHNSVADAFETGCQFESLAEGPIAYIESWYLNGQTATWSQYSRRVRLRANPDTWESSIIETWRDHSDQRFPFLLYFVDPAPPLQHTPYVRPPVGHVIVLQQPASDGAAILLSAVLLTNEGNELFQVAAYTLNRLSISAALELLPLSLVLQQHNVVVRRGRLVFPVQGAPSVGNGDSIVVEIAQPVPTPTISEMHEEAETSLLQIDVQSAQEPNLWKTFSAMPAFLVEDFCKGSHHDYKLDGPPYDPPTLTQAIVHAAAPPQNRPLRDIPPELSQLHETFLQEAAVAVEEEGPVGFVDTWYLRGHREYATENSRLLQLDQYVDEWEAAIRELWADEIDNSMPLHLHWVTPIPEALIGRDRLGHLILTQETPDHFTACHFTMRFQGLGRSAIGFAAALLRNPVRFAPTKDLLQLARICLSRRCSMRFNGYVWRDDSALDVPRGAGLEFRLGIPEERLGDEHVIEPQPILHEPVIEEPIEPAHPPLHEQTQFVRDLYASWLDHAVDGPGGLEQLLRVETWYVEGSYIRHNDEHRGVVLGEDYWEWERNLIHRWRDLINPTQETDFVIVTPTPPTAATPTEVHIILYQQLGAFDCPSLVTTYDNGILQGAPYTAAILLPAAASRDEIIAHAGKTFVCPPHMPTTSCTCWFEGIELHPLRHFPIRNGYSFMLIVHRQLRDDFWQDHPVEDEQRDETAASSFLQVSAKRLHPGSCSDAQQKQTGFQYVNLQHSIKEFDVFDSHFSCQILIWKLGHGTLPINGSLTGGILPPLATLCGFTMMVPFWHRKPQPLRLLRRFCRLMTTGSLLERSPQRFHQPLIPMMLSTMPQHLVSSWHMIFSNSMKP